jgi:hypothetical protein
MVAAGRYISAYGVGDTPELAYYSWKLAQQYTGYFYG